MAHNSYYLLTLGIKERMSSVNMVGDYGSFMLNISISKQVFVIFFRRSGEC